ncbi:hypothetical protein JTB14_003202 [Gonioctena quinquepunctata]|nr:hypothetical protein JTB14_003202 [Gonioctena quinquepunctata]
MEENYFKNQLSYIGSRLSEGIPDSDSPYTEICVDSMYLQPSDIQEVEDLIKELDNEKAPGVDEMNLFIVKAVKSEKARFPNNEFLLFQKSTNVVNNKFSQKSFEKIENLRKQFLKYLSSTTSKRLKEIVLKKLEAINKLQEEFDQRKLQRQIAVIEAQASLELEVHENYCEETKSMRAQCSYTFIPSEEYYSQVVNNPTTKIIKEFTTATQAMTQAFKSISDPFKMPLRKVVENLEDIIQTLETRFGRPEFIIDSMTYKVKLMPPVNTRYPLSLIKFANSVLNLTVTAQSLKIEAYINNPQLLGQLVQKLPEHLQFQWARIIVDKEEAIPIPTLKEFSEWLQSESSAASLLCKPSPSSFTSSDRYSERKPKTTVSVGSEETLDRRNCIFCSESGHSLYHCQKKLSLEVDGRWKWVKERSTVTLIDANLAEDEGVQSFNDPLKMNWTNSSSYIDNHSRKVSVKIQGNLDYQIYDLDDVRTVSNLNQPIQSVDIGKFANRWKHSSQVLLVDIRGATFLLLIGQDHIDLTIAREVI